jgi:hypothetical protein
MSSRNNTQAAILDRSIVHVNEYSDHAVFFVREVGGVLVEREGWALESQYKAVGGRRELVEHRVMGGR